MTSLNIPEIYKAAGRAIQTHKREEDGVFIISRRFTWRHRQVGYYSSNPCYFTCSKGTNKQEIGYANKNAKLGFTHLHFEISQLDLFMYNECL